MADARIEAYNAVDELNVQIGVASTLAGLPAALRPWLPRIQRDLFDVGADLAAPRTPGDQRLRVLESQTAWLEQACDQVSRQLRKPMGSVDPGGPPIAAQMYVARAVCRRAERRAVAYRDDCSPEVIRYLNRLSDLLLLLARIASEYPGAAN